MKTLGLISGSKRLHLDSEGMKEDTSAMGLPCLTICESSKVPTTVGQNANTMVGGEAGPNPCSVETVVSRDGKGSRICACWDGHADERIEFYLSTRSEARVANGPAAVVA